ncbi:MAG TPA: TMEM43 family protein, partial [Bacteroidia bacterium]|nr:TMEM43 family protein [Bacteroidia bacterium]
GAFCGLVLLLVAGAFLFWNEGRSVQRYKDLAEGAGAVVSIASEKVDPATEGKLVHLTGETRVSAPLVDRQFGISLPAVRLIRQAEMYQWVEEVTTTRRENKVGGGSETVKTYTYEKKWQGSPVDSSQFKQPGDHRNPTEMKYRSATVTAETVSLGAFTLPSFLVSKIGGAQPLAVGSLENASEEVRSAGRVSNGLVYFGTDPAVPAVGDIRVRFSSVPTGPVSVVAQQSGSTFVPYRARTGGSVDLLEPGTVAAADMFQMAEGRERMLAWAIRIGGFVVFGVAFSLMLKPLAVFASFLPFLGRIVETGTLIVAFLLAAILWCLIVSFAWIWYRPLLGIAILLVTVALIVLLVRRGHRPASPPRVPAFSDTPPPLA